MDHKIDFTSDGLRLSGVIGVPDGMAAGERRAAFIVLHGFGSNKSAGNVVQTTRFLSELGFVTMRFDMRGCGESEGEWGRLICLEQVRDTQAAMGALSQRAEVDPGRIGLLGSSFGAAVALYTAGVDARVAACVSSGGWGHGERKFRGQHPSPEAWARFQKMLADGREHRARTGKSLMVDRYDIVPIPDHLRHNLAEKSVEQFPAETAQSMYEFTAEDVIGNFAGRPLLLLHSSVDSVTPTEQSLRLFDKAGKPKDLHLFNETDHFMFAESNRRVRTVVREWLEMYFPAKA